MAWDAIVSGFRTDTGIWKRNEDMGRVLLIYAAYIIPNNTQQARSHIEIHLCT